MSILPHFLLAGALFLNDLPCVQKNWIFPLKDVRLKTPLDNNQTGPSGRLIVVEGVLRRTSYKLFYPFFRLDVSETDIDK